MRTASFEESFEAQLEAELGDLGPASQPFSDRRVPSSEEQPAPQVAADVPAATAAVLQRLDNGCRLVTERVRGARSASLGVFVTVGSRHEPAEIAGASHFLEHLLFKGTEQTSAASIAEALDRVGGQSNAYTARELTCFWVRLLGEDLDVGLDILGDILTDPALRASDVDAERTVIEDEILGSHDDPASIASERFFELVFASHPLGRDPLGTLASVAGIDAADVRAFFSSHYGAANLVVAAAGDVDHDHVAAAVAAWRPLGATEGRDGAMPPAAAARREVLRSPFEQAQIVVGVPIPPRSDAQRDAYRVYDRSWAAGSPRGCSPRSASARASRTRCTPSAPSSPTRAPCASRWAARPSTWTASSSSSPPRWTTSRPAG